MTAPPVRTISSACCTAAATSVWISWSYAVTDGWCGFTTGIGPVVGARFTSISGSSCAPCSSSSTLSEAMRARSNAFIRRSRPCSNCSICARAASRRLDSSDSTFSRYSRASFTMSRPCCLAISTSAFASDCASSWMRCASSTADSRMRVASSAASFTSRVADSSARSRICVLASRAVERTLAASSPSNVVTVSSSSRPGPDMPRVCMDRSSLSRNRSRSCRRASSAATMRRKSRTSPWSYPRRATGNDAAPTADGDEGSGREKEIAIARQE